MENWKIQAKAAYETMFDLDGITHKMVCRMLDKTVDKFIRSTLRRTFTPWETIDLETKDFNQTLNLNYTTKELREHLENLFEEGMHWGNYGLLWEIDHILPVSKLIKLGEKDPKIINALANLRPAWKVENMSKGAKWDEDITVEEFYDFLKSTV